MIDLLKKKSFLVNPYLFFFPFLLVYIGIVYLKQADYLVSDGGRYWDYALRLLEGRYADTIDGEYSFLWNGPGYPITLMPFAYFDTPYFFPRVMNAFYVYFGLIYFCKAIRYYTSKTKSIGITTILACYYPFLFMALPVVFTEALCFFCSCLFVYMAQSYFVQQKLKHLVLASFFLAYLVLTKVIFGYVILVLLLIFGIWYVASKRKLQILSLVKVISIAFLFCTPYLAYTYSVTGKILYWGNSGGQNLYWMSTPYEGEHGEWHFFRSLDKKYPMMYENHRDFLLSIEGLAPVEKDAALKKKAVENIMQHKKKFIKNWISNVSRTFFGFPVSGEYQNSAPLRNIILHGALLICMLLAFILTLVNIRSFTPVVLLFFLLSIIYLGGISLLSSLTRFLYPVIPFLVFWIAYTFEKYIKIAKGNDGSRDFHFSIQLGRKD